MTITVKRRMKNDGLCCKSQVQCPSISKSNSPLIPIFKTTRWETCGLKKKPAYVWPV